MFAVQSRSVQQHKMKLLYLALVLASLALAQAHYRTYAGHKVFRVTVKNEDELKRVSILQKMNYDFWIDPRIGFVDIMARPDQHLERFLNSQDLEYSLFIPDVGQLVEEQRKNVKQGRALEWTNYYRLADIYDFVDKITEEFPDLASVQTIGQSTELRDLKVIKIGASGTNKPAIWIDAGIHAREWISPAIITWMINEILRNSTQYQDILNSVDLYILPSANPDGYEFSHEQTRLWRKTRSDQNSGLGCIGVDPNRNFEYMFGEVGSSSDKCSEIYRGPEAFSEPETKAMRDFILGTDADWQLYIALHSYAQMILTPWGFTYELPDDYQDLKDLGLAAAEALNAVHGTEYEVGSVTELLSPGAGGSDDWAKGLGGFKYSYTMEVRDTGRYGFLLPPEQIIPTAEETWAAVQVMARFIGKQKMH